MVLAPGPVFGAVEAVEPPRPLFLLGPGGRRFDQAMAADLAGRSFSLLCGRYEGVDQRIADHLVDGEISIGDFVLAGGELAALAVVEAVARLVPGVMGNKASAVDESFSDGLLEYPQYTAAGRFPGVAGARGACAAGTTARSIDGGGPRPWPGRPSGDRTCWRPGAGSPTLTGPFFRSGIWLLTAPPPQIHYRWMSPRGLFRSTVP